MLFDCRPKILHKHCLQFLLAVKMAPRETENNAYAKFWRDKQRTLWYVMVFLEWSIERCLHPIKHGEVLAPVFSEIIKNPAHRVLETSKTLSCALWFKLDKQNPIRL